MDVITNYAQEGSENYTSVSTSKKLLTHTKHHLNFHEFICELSLLGQDLTSAMKITIIWNNNVLCSVHLILGLSTLKLKCNRNNFSIL